MQNLWEDYHNAEVTTGATRHIAKRRVPAEAATLAAMRSWLLHDYIVPYCRSLAATRIFRRCFWIDGLGDSRKALPIFQEVSAAAAELSGENRSMALQLLVLQPGRSKRGKASAGRAGQQTEAAPFVLPKESSIIDGDWTAIAPALLGALDQAAAVFLLNPLAAVTSSTKQESFYTSDDLAPFFTRTAPTELCLLLSHTQIENRLLPALRDPAEAAAFTTLLRSDRWRALLAEGQAPAERGEGPAGRPIIDSLIGMLQQAIQPHFLAARQIAFPVCLGPSLIENAPYTLLFATRRQDSLLCMNDAVCGYRRRLEEQSYRGLLNEAWFRERQHTRLAGEMQALTERILRLGRAQSPRRWPDLRQQLLLSNFGMYLSREYDEVIGALLEAGAVRCEWRQGRKERQERQRAAGTEQEGRRIPGNEDVLLWQEKKSYRAR